MTRKRKIGRVASLIITGFGLNCEAETAAAYRACGAKVALVHFNDLVANPRTLQEYHILNFIGGFSFGDHLGAGTVFASFVRRYLYEPLQEFIEAGKLVLGICNGFQTMARLGLVPALGKRYFDIQCALAHNDSNCFRDDWVLLRANPRSPCIFTRGIDCIPLPIRHGEGKFVVRDPMILKAIRENDLDALYYVDPITQEPTMQFPYNPNGSLAAIAGVCDPTGRIFGLMPHPEAFLSPYNHPDWIQQLLNGILPKEGLGLLFFKNAVDFAARELL